MYVYIKKRKSNINLKEIISFPSDLLFHSFINSVTHIEMEKYLPKRFTFRSLIPILVVFGDRTFGEMIRFGFVFGSEDEALVMSLVPL